VVPYWHEPEDTKESHDKPSLIILLITKQDSDQTMIHPCCHGGTTRYQVVTAVLLLVGCDVVTIGKWLQTAVSIYL